MFRILAYRIQQDRFGGLKPETRRLLDQMVPPDNASGSLKGRNARRPPDILRPGTVLVREWKGKRQHVMTLARGFSWNDREFRSLSEVANAITGTRWSGPRFFGLRDSKR